MSYRFFECGDPWLFFEEDLLSEEPIFVIVGSYTGESEREILGFYNKARVIVYEASIRNFINLSYQTRFLSLKLYNKAVTGYDGETTFYEYGKPSSHSHVKRKIKAFDEYSVRCVSVETILKENLIDYVDVMLVTVRGPESVLLDLLDKEEVKQVCFHWYNDFSDIREELRSKLEEKFEIIDSPKEGAYACTLLIRK